MISLSAGGGSVSCAENLPLSTARDVLDMIRLQYGPVTARSAFLATRTVYECDGIDFIGLYDQ